MIKSRYGFYVGDVSSVLIDYCYKMFTDGNYTWNDDNDDEVKEVKVNPADMEPLPRTDCNVFGVVCDVEEGVYQDQYDNDYYVDEYNIGIVPIELCDKNKLTSSNGRFFASPGTATITKKGSMILVVINGEKIYIDISNYDDDVDLDEYYDEDEFDNNDGDGWDGEKYIDGDIAGEPYFVED